MKTLIFNKRDYTRIRQHIADARQLQSISQTEAERLLSELGAAQVVEPEEVPVDVVTMNSVVKLSFLNTGKQIQFQIVYPGEADLKANKISIFSPVATALIGSKVHDEIEWLVPGGMTKIRIDEILYQPEAAGLPE